MKKDAELPAVHDWHLKDVLTGLGLLERLERGELRCVRCGVSLNMGNVGGILVGPKHTYNLVCSGLLCLSEPRAEVGK